MFHVIFDCVTDTDLIIIIIIVGNLMENRPSISKNALFDEFFVNPRPLYNSNMAKESSVK